VSHKAAFFINIPVCAHRTDMFTVRRRREAQGQRRNFQNVRLGEINIGNVNIQLVSLVTSHWRPHLALCAF